MSNRALRLAALAFSFLVLLTGCGHTDAQLRFVNTSPGEPSLNSLDGTTVATGVAYGTGGSYSSTLPGPRHLNVYSSGTTNAIVNQTISLSSGTDYSLFAINFSFDITAILLADDNSTPSSGNVKLRVLNASPGLGAVDVYVVDLGTDLNSVTPSVGSLTFESSSAYVTGSGGSWEIVFTLPGRKTALVTTGTLALVSAQIRTVVALNGEAGGYTTAVLPDLN